MHKLEGPGFLPRHSSTAVGCWILGMVHAEKRGAKNKREAVRKQGKTSTGVVSFFLGWLLNSFKIWSFMYDTLPQPPKFYGCQYVPLHRYGTALFILLRLDFIVRNMGKLKNLLGVGKYQTKQGRRPIGDMVKRRQNKKEGAGTE